MQQLKRVVFRSDTVKLVATYVADVPKWVESLPLVWADDEILDGGIDNTDSDTGRTMTLTNR